MTPAVVHAQGYSWDDPWPICGANSVEWSDRDERVTCRRCLKKLAADERWREQMRRADEREWRRMTAWLRRNPPTAFVCGGLDRTPAVRS